MKHLILPLLIATSSLLWAENPAVETSVNVGENVTDSATKKNPAMQPVVDVPGLPRVLIIGDSISIGYTKDIREKLKGVANVHRIPANGQSTEIGLKKLDGWLGDKKFDVIAFNFGLHDSKYLTADATKVSREDYAKNLQEIIRRIKATGAQPLFINTTPVPDKLEPADRRFDSISTRNEIAAKVMAENNVPIVDVYSVLQPRLPELQRPFDVHFLPTGYVLLADTIAPAIRTQLPKSK